MKIRNQSCSRSLFAVAGVRNKCCWSFSEFLAFWPSSSFERLWSAFASSFGVLIDNLSFLKVCGLGWCLLLLWWFSSLESVTARTCCGILTGFDLLGASCHLCVLPGVFHQWILAEFVPQPAQGLEVPQFFICLPHGCRVFVLPLPKTSNPHTSYCLILQNSNSSLRSNTSVLGLLASILCWIHSKIHFFFLVWAFLTEAASVARNDLGHQGCWWWGLFEPGLAREAGFACRLPWQW